MVFIVDLIQQHLSLVSLSLLSDNNLCHLHSLSLLSDNNNLCHLHSLSLLSDNNLCHLHSLALLSDNNLCHLNSLSLLSDNNNLCHLHSFLVSTTRPPPATTCAGSACCAWRLCASSARGAPSTSGSMTTETMTESTGAVPCSHSAPVSVSITKAPSTQ